VTYSAREMARNEYDWDLIARRMQKEVFSTVLTER